MTYLVGLGALLTFTLCVSGCGQAVLCNRWVVGLRTAPASRKNERLKDWVGLPLAAYVLAIVCNVGTSLLDGDVPRAFYAIGLLALGAGAIMISGSLIALRPVVRTPWRYVGSWEGLQAEVEEQQALRKLPDRAWLADARSTQRRLDLAHGQSQRLAARASRLMLGRVMPDSACPQWGFGVLRDAHGARVPIPWRCVVRWGVRDWWALSTLACAVATVILAAVTPVAPQSSSVTDLVVVAALAAVIVSVIFGTKSFLLYYARLDLEWHDTAQAVDAVLGRWEREVRRSRRLPHRPTVP